MEIGISLLTFCIGEVQPFLSRVSFEEEGWQVLAAAVGAVAGMIAIVEFSVRQRRKQRLIDDIPTCKTAGVFIGLVEVKGTAESDDPLTSHLAEKLCVHYNYAVSEQWRRMVTETYTDSKGRVKTRTRMKTGWDVVDHGSRSTPFYLQDDSGLLKIRPTGADIDAATILSRTCTASNALYYQKGPSSSVFGSTGTRRFVEYAIPLHRRIYVMGASRLRKDVVAPEIASDKDAPMFLISVKSEEQKRKSFALRFWGLLFLGLAIYVGGPWALATNVQGVTPWLIGLVGGFIYSSYGLLRWAIMVYNSLLGLRNRVEQAWKNVDVQLKRRFDLIPRLVEVVKGYKQYEKEVQEELVLLRREGELSSSDVATACSPTLLALKESYPDLEADTLFQELHDELVNTEDKIALARGYYNDIVAENNERIERFPDNLFRSIARMRRRKYHEARDFERASVKVDLVSDETDAESSPAT